MKWQIRHDVAGGEYWGVTYVFAKKVTQIDNTSFKADDVIIVLNEVIHSITRIKNEKAKV